MSIAMSFSPSLRLDNWRMETGQKCTSSEDAEFTLNSMIESYPIEALGDALASAVNPNVDVLLLAHIVSEIEAQLVRWIAEMIG